jgi:hypothetical protein
MSRPQCTKTWCEHVPRCRDSHDNHVTFSWGRCKSGKRWFWHVHRWAPSKDAWDGSKWHGYESTEADAVQVAFDKIKAEASGKPVSLHTLHGWAQEELKRINRSKRKERLAANPSPANAGAAVEYLYAGDWSDRYSDAYYGPPEWYVWRFRITKKTKERIFYIRKGERIDPGAAKYAQYSGIRDLDEEQIAYVDRGAMEASGEEGLYTRKWYSDDWHLFLAPPPKPTFKPGDNVDAETLRKLRAQMVAAHPDRGGTNEAFRAARQRYVELRRRLEAQV